MRVRELAGGIDDATERLSAYAGLWTGSLMRGELAPMLEMANALLRKAEGMPGTSASVIAHRIFGTTCSFQGDFTTAKHHLEKAVSAYNQERDGHLAHRFGHDIGVAAEFYLALTLWPLGEIDRAHQVAESALERARRGEHRPTMAFAHAYMCVFGSCGGRRRRRHRMPTPSSASASSTAWNGGRSRALSFVAGHAGMRAPATPGWLTCAKAWPFAARSGCRRHTRSSRRCSPTPKRRKDGSTRLLPCTTRFFTTIELSGELWRKAETQRHRGNLLRRRGANDLAEAEVTLLKALDTARRQKAPVYELRAALDLAGLYRDLEQWPRARLVLEPTLLDLAMGFELQEVKRARDLISSLRPSGEPNNLR